ncbi:MAG TPA: glycosyltransferase family 2 protein [Candidatus Limnocylindrales bacterium]|nr:glycosyltransferase family 2 protein [Candidatus Limnocylindrales bacterium]
MILKENTVSIIMPVYNAGKFLTECLQSLSDQTYQDIQIIAIDDLSRDNSWSILRKFQKEMKNLKIYKNKKHYGMSVCYNRAMKMASGQFLAFTNPNDLNHLNRIKRQVSYLLQNPRTVAVGTQYTRIDDESVKIERISLPQEHETIYENLLHTKSLYPETVMINRLLIPKDLLYFTSNRYPFIFNEVFAKFFQYGTVANIGHALYHHRVGLKRNKRKASKINHIANTFKLWLKSRREHDYRPSMRSTLSSLAKRADIKSSLPGLLRNA